MSWGKTAGTFYLGSGRAVGHPSSVGESGAYDLPAGGTQSEGKGVNRWLESAMATSEDQLRAAVDEVLEPA